MSKLPSSILADLDAVSKHSHYQTLHPALSAHIGFPDSYRPRKLLEAERDDFIGRFVDFKGAAVADIGANTGYFTISAMEKGADQITALEGNLHHANFLESCAETMGVSDKIRVQNQYVNFEPYDLPYFDILMCFNVLHHLGDDFRPETQQKDALEKMGHALRQIVMHARTTIFQIGFNWKGDRNSPLTTNGTKQEIVDFVNQSVQGLKVQVLVGCYDKGSRAYQRMNAQNMARFDDLGEFANRPLFIITNTEATKP